MAKKKKNLAEQVISKSKKQKSTLNPFEIHVNRQKFNVLGRKLKTDRGLPGVSKARALKKRKETLLPEYKLLNKSNKFLDRRVGENNSAMTQSDRIIARFSAAKMKKSGIDFNLNDDNDIDINDVEISLRGKSIAEIDKLEDPVFSDDEDLQPLDADFVKDANFGSKTSRLSVLDQLIADSKKNKAERQMAKEKIVQETEKLDSDWKLLMPHLNMGKKDDVYVKKDPFDLIMADLKFEARGTPTNKLKTENEIAEGEATKLKELEEARLMRMRGENPSNAPKISHRSADDLDDGFEIEDKSFELIYNKEGNPIGFDKISGDSIFPKKGHGSSDDSEGEDESDANDSEIEENDSENEDGDDESDHLSDYEVNEDEKNEHNSEDEIENDMPKNINLENKEEIKIETLCQSANASNAVKSIEEDSQSKPKIKKKKVCFSNELVTFKEAEDTSKLSTMDPDEKIKLLEGPYSDIPFTIDAPSEYDEFVELLKHRTHKEQAIIVGRIIKCTHPSLNEKNKEKLEQIFLFLLQHLDDSDESESWLILDHLAPHFFTLTQFSPNNAAYCLCEVINVKHSHYLKRKYKYPTSETFLYLKLVPLLFPTSDKRHQVTTTSFVFICEMLRHCNVITKRTVAAGLFLVSLVTEYILLSKRIMPEALNFLSGVISMASPVSDLPVLSPFKKEHKFLYLLESQADLELDYIMPISDLVLKGPKIDNEFRIRSVFCALKLLLLLAENYEEMGESKLLFEPIKKHIDMLELHKYPAPVKDVHNQLMEVLKQIFDKELVPLTIQAVKPKVLRLYEPSIKPVYEIEKKYVKGGKEDLKQKIKQANKGAIREIRKDRSFVANIKFREQAASDVERKRKVKELYSSIAQQEGEFKKLKRKRK